MARSSSLLLRGLTGVMINSVLIILLAICGLQSAADPTIAAEPGAFNYFVMVWYNSEFLCGGTIVDQRHVITRGTCVLDIPCSNLSIIAGTIGTKVTGIHPVQVESVHIHYGFKAIDDAVMLGEIHWVHDIAVLKLVNRMVWDPHTAAAALITNEFNWDLTSKFVVPGWRRTHIGMKQENYYIRWSRGKLYADKNCLKSGVRLLKNEKCARWIAPFQSWTHTLHYYSGSPIVYDNTVIGIVDGRKRGKFHALLNLLPYTEFIEDVSDDRKHDVNSGEINYVVSVWYDYRFQCGGIILHASHILTTADCVRYADHTRLHVIAGQTQVLESDPQIQWLSVDKIERHPEYEDIFYFDGPKSIRVKNNYAVLKLAVPLEWGPTIGAAPLSNTHFVPTDLACGAYRWHNAYNVDDEVLLQLISSREVVMNAELCQKAGIDLEADEICVSSQYAQHPRNLDSSGNPVVCEGSVIGIIIPDFSIVPRFSCLTSILSISPFMNSLSDKCYEVPIN